MDKGFLDKILTVQRKNVAHLRKNADIESMRDKAISVRANSKTSSLFAELSRNDRVNIIAEIKRASPSKGIINAELDVPSVAAGYRDGGACAISVLTEENFFQGSKADLTAVRMAVDLPILRKDFIVDALQIYESAIIGADTILLIVAALNEEEIIEFGEIAQEELGMDAIVEVHDGREFEIAKRAGARIIGVNNRNLRNFETSLDVASDLIRQDRPANVMMIAESGLSSASEIEELQKLGFNGFLIGETLMKAKDPALAIGQLMGEK